MARNANDTEPMSERPEPGDGDDVDSMLNALQVSPQRGRKRGPEITPAPEAIAKAKSEANDGTGKKKRESAKTLQMGGAPALPAEVVNARVASDPAEQAFLNKTEEAARPRRRDEKTMMTGMAPPAAPASSYLVSAVIAFVAVLAVGLIGWRVMKYMEAQGPVRDPSADTRGIGTPANTSASTVAAPLTAKPVGTLALPTAVSSSNAGAAPVAVGTDDPTQAAPGTTVSAPGGTVASSAGSAKAAGKPPGASTGAGAGAVPAGSAPGGKYGGMVSPELQ